MNAPHCPRLIEGVGAISYRHVLGSTAGSQRSGLSRCIRQQPAVFCCIADEKTISEAQRCSDDRLGTGSSQMTLTMRPSGLGHGVYKDGVEVSASQSRSIGRALPYVLSWAVLGILMVIGSERLRSALYRPVDGDWAKWNVEAILHFGKPFDLGP